MANFTKHHYDLDGDMRTLSFMRGDLGLECVGMGIGKIKSGKGYPFFHKHEQQEEVYMCLDGSFTLIVDGEEMTLTKGDVVRVAAEASRAVGNKTQDTGTMLVVGAMPFDPKYKGEEGKSLIGDGIPGSGDAPDWSI